MNKLEDHFIADIFPLIEGEEFEKLVIDIKDRGVLEPIWLYEGKILDGRNRYRASIKAGRTFKTKTFPNDASTEFQDNPVAFVLSLNLHRRHLSQSQLAVLGLEIERVEAKLAEQRMEAAGEHGKEGGRGKKKTKTPSAQMRQGFKNKGKASEKAAKAVGTSARYISEAKKIAKEAPEYIKDIKSGKKTITQVKREIKEANQKEEFRREVKVTLAPGLHRGDFRNLSDKIEDNSVDLVFTDPPYDRESIPLYGDAARIAARILKPGGSFIAYCGQYCLPEILGECKQHLRYWWTIAGLHGGSKAMMEKYGLRVCWKPLVWFVKETRGDIRNVIFDVVTGKREKDAHEWQQAEEEARYYIENLTTPNGLVVDFFVGGGTTPAAAQKLGRRFIGFEISAKHIERASKRLEAA